MIGRVILITIIASQNVQNMFLQRMALKDKQGGYCYLHFIEEITEVQRG
jgi:hypothetical protein